MRYHRVMVNIGIATLVVVLSAAGLGGVRASAADPEFRGMWVTRFGSPSEWVDPDEAISKGKIDTVMQKLATNNFNAAVFQVRGQADTLYPSPYEPWSELIAPTGVDPGWDPLAYVIDKAHNPVSGDPTKRLEFHAYINAHVAWQRQARTGEDIIVDNLDLGFTELSGPWGVAADATAYPTPLGSYRTRATTKTTTLGEVEWRPNLPADDWYDVSVWYPAIAGGITNAQYTIEYSGGSQTVSVNQTMNGAKWNVIGSPQFFVAGTTGHVRLNNSSTSTGTVFADAVRFRRMSPRDPNHVYYQHCNALDPAHRDWLVNTAPGAVPPQYGSDSYVWVAPGIPAFQAYWRKQVMYVVQNYDVDGVHFDRIRTPGNAYSHDAISEARRAGEGNPAALDFADWSRNQITRMLCDLYAQIMEVKPQVKISSAPVGLYRWERYQAYSGYPQRDCGFFYGYSCVFQDAQAWLAAGAMDFIVPQIYWADPPYRAGAPHFSEVLPDWVTNNGGRHVYPGQSSGVGAPELVHEIGVTRTMGGEGNVVFSYSNFNNNNYWPSYSGAGGPYEQPADVPAMPWKDNPTTGIIIGNVMNGIAPVVDAHITRNGSSYTALSSGDGLYSFLLVPPGTYTLTVTKNELGTRVVTGVTVAPGQVKRVNVKFGPDFDNDGVCDDDDLCPNTIPGAPVDADGCPSPAIPADFDNDGDVDGDDVNAFVACASGPAVPLAPGCEGKDLDNDGHVDQSDFGIVQLCYNGQDNPGDPNCAPNCAP